MLCEAWKDDSRYTKIPCEILFGSDVAAGFPILFTKHESNLINSSSYEESFSADFSILPLVSYPSPLFNAIPSHPILKSRKDISLPFFSYVTAILLNCLIEWDQQMVV